MKQVWAKLTCLSCQSEIVQVVNTFLNAGVDKQLKSRILQDEQFVMLCPKCHSKVPMVYPCIYKDQKKKLLVYVKQIQAVNHHDLHQRFVKTIEELKELIVIFEHDLDDRGVYLLKDKLSLHETNQSKSIQFYFADEEYLGFIVDHQVKLILRSFYDQMIQELPKEEASVYYLGKKYSK